KLELPQIAQLMEVLRDKEKLPINSLPLTIGQARQELAHLFSRESVQHAGSILPA
ncbi:MAG: hypothetical protein GQ468_06290, partial [Candidatus Scalindua sp.]|nr:hypothetical protein [Candidatus Scalindua sp.]